MINKKFMKFKNNVKNKNLKNMINFCLYKIFIKNKIILFYKFNKMKSINNKKIH